MEISPEYPLEGPMLTTILQYFGHLMRRADSLEQTPMLGKIGEGGGEGGNREWDGWMASETQWTWIWVNSGSWRWTGKPGILQSMGSQRFRHDWATELNWGSPCFGKKIEFSLLGNPSWSRMFYHWCFIVINIPVMFYSHGVKGKENNRRH